MTTPKPKLDLFNESPFLVSKKCRTSTPSLRPPKPPTKSSKLIRINRNNSLNSNSSNNHHNQSGISLIPTNVNNNNYNNFNQTLPTTFNPSSDFSFTPPPEGRLNISFGSSSNNNLICEDNEFDENGLNRGALITSATNSSRLAKEFEIICKIGSGYFADVYKVKSIRDHQFYAIKKTSIPYTSNSDRLRKLQEVKNHESVPPHPNCVKYYDSWEEDGYLYIQTELCKISLNEILESSEERKLPEHLVWSYLIDLLLAVKHLHDNQLLHLDIKPDNILISFEGVAKLADFGLMCNCNNLNSSINHYGENNQHNQNYSEQNSINTTQMMINQQNNNLNSTQNHNSSFNFNQSITTATTTTNRVTARLETINDDHDLSIIDDINRNDISLNCALNDVDEEMTFEDGIGNETFNIPNDHDDSGIINRSEESIDSIDEGDSKYLASETMQGKFTKAADIFCLGITIFEVASGLDLPQRGEVYHKLRHNEFEDLYFNGLSADLVTIIKLMMEEDYTKRATVDDLLQLDSIQLRIGSKNQSHNCM